MFPVILGLSRGLGNRQMATLSCTFSPNNQSISMGNAFLGQVRVVSRVCILVLPLTTFLTHLELWGEIKYSNLVLLIIAAGVWYPTL